MKALVYQGPSKKALEERPKPELTAAGDAIVRVAKTTICGTDLHILKGDVPMSIGTGLGPPIGVRPWGWTE
jgi:alcohol dehydrogenase